MADISSITLPGGSTYDLKDAAARGSSQTVTLAAADWSGNAQTKSVTGVTSTNTVIVSYAPSDRAAYLAAEIYCSAQGSGTLTFTCGTTPTTAIGVNVRILP